MIGRTLELRYLDPSAGDTWIGVPVDADSAWIVRVLVLHDPLGEYQGVATVSALASTLRLWTVKDWSA